MGNPWRKPFVPAHRKPKDRLKDQKLGTYSKPEPVVCLDCGAARLLHPTKTCTEYREKE